MLRVNLDKKTARDLFSHAAKEMRYFYELTLLVFQKPQSSGFSYSLHLVIDPQFAINIASMGLDRIHLENKAGRNLLP